MKNSLYNHLKKHTLRWSPTDQKLNRDLSWLSPLKGESLELMQQIGGDGLWAHDLLEFKALLTSASIRLYDKIGDAVRENPGKAVFLIYVGLHSEPQGESPVLKPYCFLAVGQEDHLQMAMKAMISKQILQK